MTRKNHWFDIAATLAVALTIHADAMPRGPAIASANDESPDQGKLDGTWLVRSADSNRSSLVSESWTSKVVIGAGKFSVSHFCGSSRDLTGTFRLDQATTPRTVTLNVDGIDLSEVWEGVKYPNCTLPGIYGLRRDTLTICLNTGSKLERPTSFSPNDAETIVLSLVRADADFKEFPKTVAVTVTDWTDKPVAGASIFKFMDLRRDPASKDAPRNWKYWEIAKTDASGVARMAYDDLSICLVAARDADRKLIGICSVSPASLQKGAVRVSLHSERRVMGRITCDEFAGAGKAIEWTNAYLLVDGQRIGGCVGPGEFEFRLPPGRFTVDVYGEDLEGKYVDITVPAGQADFQLPPIPLLASNLVRLRGKPAPELEGVVGWRGEPVKLADLKSKYVLIDFWGYWCGPCVGAMPTLIELHERFKDKGLVIVGVHCDMNGEIDTPAKLDGKIALLKEKVWKGKDLTFPIALTTKSSSYSEQTYDGTAAAQYGVLAYPTTILIDKEGKVVGQFAAHDTKKAIADVEELLARK